MRAHGRFRDARAKAYALHPDQQLSDFEAEAIFYELFVTLSWLDLLLRHAATDSMGSQLVTALKFVRGKVHHRLADAIEFRRDVLLQLHPTTASGSQSGPLAISDWCWRATTEVLDGPRTKSRSSARWKKEEAYERALARTQVSSALDRVATLAGGLFAAEPTC